MPIAGRPYLASLIQASDAPCISIYQPTHRRHPENAQDPIRFRNLIKQVEASLLQRFPTRDVRALLAPLHELAADEEFWNHTLDGLAVMASESRFDVFHLSRSIPELVVVSDSFHVKPLLRHYQSADRFHVLALAEDKFALYEGTRYGLDPIRAPKVSTRAPAPSDPSGRTVVGEGMAGYFRAVDAAVAAEVSSSSHVPLLLAALPENASHFRAAAKNPHLLKETILGDPFAIDAEALRSRAWSIFEPHYVGRLKRLADDFGLAAHRQQGTGDLSDAARAAVAGRIATVLLESDRTEPGRIDPVTGAIVAKELCDPKVDDKFDDLAELVLKTGGEVVMVPADRMPTKTGLAAIYRF